ncbi:hypothetical protein AOLI_G00314680 [Acnodon oligacanthus]
MTAAPVKHEGERQHTPAPLGNTEPQNREEPPRPPPSLRTQPTASSQSSSTERSELAELVVILQLLPAGSANSCARSSESAMMMELDLRVRRRRVSVKEDRKRQRRSTNEPILNEGESVDLMPFEQRYVSFVFTVLRRASVSR